MNQSESLDLLAKALVAAQAEFAPVAKRAENPFFKSHYADLASIVEAASPIAAKHGLAVSQFPSVLDGEPSLVTYLIHESGQWLSSEMKVLAKLDPQGQGSGISYARRYAYSSVLGIVTEADDDGNAAQPSTPAPTTRREPPQRRSQPIEARAQALAGVDPSKISEKQIKLVAVLFKNKGFPEDRDIRHAFAAVAVGHEFDSTKNLSKADASKLIDALNAEPEPGEPQYAEGEETF